MKSPLLVFDISNMLNGSLNVPDKEIHYYWIKRIQSKIYVDFSGDISIVYLLYDACTLFLIILLNL